MERSVPRDGLRGPGGCRKTGLLTLWPHTSMDCPSHFLLGSHTSDSLAQSKSKSPAVPSSIEGGKVSLLLNLPVLPLWPFCDLFLALLSKSCPAFAFVHPLYPQWPCPSPQVVGFPYQVPPESCTCLLCKFFHPLNFSYTSFLALGTHVLL